VIDRRRRTVGALAAIGGGVLASAMLVAPALAADEAVTIAGFAYDPATITVSVGDSVTWTNNDGVVHTATADNGSFDTGTIGDGASGSVTFSAAGTFAYHCTIHSSMAGTVVVEAAAGGDGGGGGGGSATPPPTDVSPATDAAGPGWAVVLAIVGLAGLGAVPFALRRFRGGRSR
jgi:plastocyanin